MFFEARLSPIPTSTAYEGVAAAFERGETTTAHEFALVAAATHGPSCPADFLLVMDICRARGEYARSNALCRIARRRFPDDPMVTLAWARTASIRGRDLEALELLEPLTTHSHLGALARALMASSWGTIGARRRFRALADPLRDCDDPRVRYMLGYGAASLREWDEAIEHLTFAVDHAPGWVRATGPLCDFLLARGRVSEVERRLVAAERSGLHDVAVDVAAFAYLSARRRWEQAVDLAERAATRWPARSLEMFAGGVALAYWMLRRRDDAVRWAKLVDPDLAQRFAAATPGRHRLLDAPLRCQERSMCLPVSVSLVCATQGVELDPVALYAAMEGHGGASFSKMKSAVDALGFDTSPVLPRAATVRRLLDEGIALIGPLYGPGLAHVEVVCGYDEALDLLFIRDPESWILRAYSSDALDERYREHGGLLALMKRPAALQLSEDERAHDFANFIAFEAVVTAGDATSASSLLTTIPDGPTRMLAHWVGHGVSSSTLDVRAYERRCMADPSLSARFRAAVALQGDVAELEQTREMLLTADADPRSWLIRMLDVRIAIRDGRWDEAARITDELVEEAPSLATTWEMKATIAERRGDDEAALEAVDLAYDIEPTHHGITSHWRRHLDTRRPFAARLTDVEDIWRRFDSVETAWSDHVGLLAAFGPDGALVADLMARWTRRYPRSPDAWTERMRWFAFQDRSDLVESIREEASHALGMDPHRAGADVSPSKKPTSGPNEALARAMEQVLRGERVEGDLAVAMEQLRGRALRGTLDSLLHVWLLALDFAIDLSRDPSLPAALPEQLPGTRLASMRAFLERISGLSLQPRHATDLVAWIHARLPECDSQGVLLWERAALQRIRGHLVDAEALLQRLVAREPAHVSALEELASLAVQRGDVLGAIRRYEALLEVFPGQIGALTALVQLHELAGDRERTIATQRRLVRRMPWQSQASERLVELTELAALEEVRPYFDDAALRIMQARVAYDAGDHARVLELLATQATTPTSSQVAALDPRPSDAEDTATALRSLDDRQLRMHHALLLESSLAVADEGPVSEEIEALAEAATLRFPDGPLFWRLRASLALRAGDPPRFRACIAGAVAAGAFDVDLATLLVDVDGAELPRALELVASAPPESREDVALTWVEMLERAGDVHLLAEFLERCVPLVDGGRDLRLRQGWFALREGDLESAIWSSERLLARDPEDVDGKLLRANALMSTDEAESSRLFEELAAFSGDPRARIGLAAHATRRGDLRAAMKLYWEILRVNPLDTGALVSLAEAHESAVVLAPWFRAAIERGQGAETPNFLVYAVEIARGSRTRVPKRWLELAMQRLVRADEAPDETEGTSSSEWILLPRAVYVYLRHLGEYEALHALVHANPDIRGPRWMWAAPGRMFWPGRAWLPREPELPSLAMGNLVVPSYARPSNDGQG